jgi:hypothetical protein
MDLCERGIHISRKRVFAAIAETFHAVQSHAR